MAKLRDFLNDSDYRGELEEQGYEMVKQENMIADEYSHKLKPYTTPIDLDPYTKSVIAMHGAMQEMKDKIAFMQMMETLSGGGGGGGVISGGGGNPVLENSVFNYGIGGDLSGLQLGQYVSLGSSPFDAQVVKIDKNGRITFKEYRHVYNTWGQDRIAERLGEQMLADMALNNPKQAAGLIASYMPSHADPNYIYQKVKAITDSFLGNEAIKRLSEQRDRLAEKLKEAKTPEEREIIDKNIAYLDEQTKRLYQGDIQAMLADSVINLNRYRKINEQSNDIAVLGFDRAISQSGYLVNAEKYLSNQKRYSELAMQEYYVQKAGRINEYYRSIGEDIQVSDKEVKATLDKLRTNGILTEREAAISEFLRGAYYDLNVLDNIVNHRSYVESLEKISDYQGWSNRHKVMMSGMTDDKLYHVISPEYKIRVKGKNYGYSVLQEGLSEEDRKTYSGIAIGGSFADKEDGVGESFLRALGQWVGTTVKVGTFFTGMGVPLSDLGFYNLIDDLMPVGSYKAERAFYKDNPYGRDWNFSADKLTNSITHFVGDLVTSFGVGAGVKMGLTAGAKYLSRFAAKEGTSFIGKNLARKGSEFMTKAAIKEYTLLKGVPFAGRISVPTVIGAGAIDAQETWQEGSNAGVNWATNALTTLGTMVSVGVLENLIDLDGFGRQILGVKLGFKDVPKEATQELTKIKGLKSAYQYAKQKIGVEVPKVADEANVRSVFDTTVYNTLSLDVHQEMFRKAMGIKKEDVFTEVVTDEAGKKIQKFYRRLDDAPSQKVDELGTVSAADIERAGVNNRFVKDGQLYEINEAGEIVRTPLVETNEYGLTQTEITKAYQIGLEKTRNRFAKFAFMQKPAKFILGSALEGATEIAQDVSSLGFKIGANALDTMMGLTVTDSEYESIYKRLRAGEKVSQDELDDFFRRGLYETGYGTSEMVEAGLAGALFGAGAHVVGGVRSRLSGKTPEKEFLKREQEYRNNLASVYGLRLDNEEDRKKLDEIYSSSFNLTRLVHLGLDQDYLLNLKKLEKRGLVGKSYYQEQKDFIDNYKVQSFLYGDALNRAWSKLDYNIKNGAAADVAKAVYIAKLRHKDNLMAARNRLQKILSTTTVADKNLSPDFFEKLRLGKEIDTQQTLEEIVQQYEQGIASLEKDEKIALVDFVNARRTEIADAIRQTESMYNTLIGNAKTEVEKDVLTEALRTFLDQHNSVYKALSSNASPLPVSGVGESSSLYFDEDIAQRAVSYNNQSVTVRDIIFGNGQIPSFNDTITELNEKISRLLSAKTSHSEAQGIIDEIKNRITEERNKIQALTPQVQSKSGLFTNDYYAKANSHDIMLNQVSGLLNTYEKHVMPDSNNFKVAQQEFKKAFDKHKFRFDFTGLSAKDASLYFDIYKEFEEFRKKNPSIFDEANKLSKTVEAKTFFRSIHRLIEGDVKQFFANEVSVIEDAINNPDSANIENANKAIVRIYEGLSNRSVSQDAANALNNGQYTAELLLELSAPIVKAVREEYAQKDLDALLEYNNKIVKIYASTKKAPFPKKGKKSEFFSYYRKLKGGEIPLHQEYIPFIKDTFATYNKMYRADKTYAASAFLFSVYADLLSRRHRGISAPTAVGVVAGTSQMEFRNQTEKEIALSEFEQYYNERKDVYNVFKDFEGEIRKAKEQFIERKLKIKLTDPQSAKRAIDDYNIFVEPIKEVLRKTEEQLADTDRFLEKEYHEMVKDIDVAIESSTLNELKKINISYLDPETKEYYKDIVKENIPQFLRYFFLQRSFKYFVPAVDEVVKKIGEYTSPSHYTSVSNNTNAAHWIAQVNHLINNPSVANEVVHFLTEPVVELHKAEQEDLFREAIDMINKNPSWEDALLFATMGMPIDFNNTQEAYSAIRELAYLFKEKTANPQTLRFVEIANKIEQKQSLIQAYTLDKTKLLIKDLIALPYENVLQFNEVLKKEIENIVEEVGGGESVKEDLYQALYSFIGLVDQSLNPNAEQTNEVMRMKQIFNGVTGKNGVTIGNEQKHIYDRTNIYAFSSVMGLAFADRLPNRESLTLILDSILSQGQGGIYNEALLEHINLKDIDNLLSLLEDIEVLINSNLNIGVDVNTLYNSGQTLKEIVHNFKEELNALKEAATNIAVLKHNKSVLETTNAIENLIRQIPESDDTDPSGANIQAIKEWAKEPYYTYEKFGRISYYKYDPSRLEVLFNALKGIRGMEKYFDAEKEYLSANNIAFPYSVVQRLNAWLYAYGYITNRAVYVSGQGGTGKTSSIKLALETIARMTVAQGKKLNVHVVVPNESLVGNKAYNDYTDKINATIEVLNTHYNKETYKSYISEIQKGWNKEKGILVIDEYTLFNKELSDALSEKMKENPNGMSVFFVFDMGQMSHTNNYDSQGEAELNLVSDVQPIYGFSSHVIWRNANYGLNKAIENTAFIYSNDDKGAPYSIPKNKLQTITDLAKNLYLSDDGAQGADVAKEEAFFKQASDALANGKSVFLLTANKEEKEKLKAKYPDLESVIFEISEKQGSEADVVFVHTEKLGSETNNELFQSMLYTATTRAKEKVVYSSHLFDSNQVPVGVSVYKTDQNIAGQGMEFAIERNHDLLNATYPKDPNVNHSFNKTVRKTTTVSSPQTVTVKPVPSLTVSVPNQTTTASVASTTPKTSTAITLTAPEAKTFSIKQKQTELSSQKIIGIIGSFVSLLPDEYNTTVC